MPCHVWVLLESSRISWLEFCCHAFDFSLTPHRRSVLLVKRLLYCLLMEDCVLLSTVKRPSNENELKGTTAFRHSPDEADIVPPSQPLCASSQSLGLSSQTCQPHVHASCVCPERTIRKPGDYMCCPFFPIHVLNVPCVCSCCLN